MYFDSKGNHMGLMYSLPLLILRQQDWHVVCLMLLVQLYGMMVSLVNIKEIWRFVIHWPSFTCYIENFHQV